MKELIPINKLSERTGLTSRTLRHWETEGLFRSGRDPGSGWRVYDEDAVQRITITAQLRKLDFSLKEISHFFTDMSAAEFKLLIERKAASLKSERQELRRSEEKLAALLELLTLKNSDWLSVLEEISNHPEAIEMEMEKHGEDKSLKVITLSPMRVVYHTAVGVAPEDEATQPIVEWVKASGLSGTARLFGGNVKPLPAKSGLPYGYGMCASIPEGIRIPEIFKEMKLPGGLYAMLESGDDIGGSWNKLMGMIQKNTKYKSDPSRLCLEEHIRNDTPEGSGNLYLLHLLQPVMPK